MAWNFLKRRRIEGPQEPGDEPGSAPFSNVALSAVNIALEITSSVSPAGEHRPRLSQGEWATAKESLAFALTVIDRYAFGMTRGDIRDHIMRKIVPASASLIAAMAQERVDVDNTIRELDEIGREYGALTDLYPGEGRLRPTVSEAAHRRIMSTLGDADASNVQLMIDMINIVSKHQLHEIIRVDVAAWARRLPVDPIA